MTLECILQAAVSSMIKGHHAPYCYSAHVIGRGYVNDGSKVYDRTDYLRQLERDAQSEVENMGWAPKYAESGYDQPKRGIVMANWNKLPRELGAILERAGYAIEWSDEWATCDSCNGAVRTQPDGHGWEPGYRETESGDTFCLECYADENPDDEDSDTDE